ncbi:hypothetical protein QBC47DRAFT_402418 [Echria macrotheca]|uniref:Uncharacterized protein n=1 Tax=Echria macrotheca TaxID=438768 RepID=A0AAJ0FB86_9PEZI|nr:hypothetical protein QBC47DRAFT_402418 [Echria macrotheca]
MEAELPPVHGTKAGQLSIKNAPLPSIPGPPRYRVFPKPQPRQKLPSVQARPTVDGVLAVRRNQNTADGFTNESEKLVIATDAVGELPSSTASARETHISIHTVQELLPYRQQFRDAGLAALPALPLSSPASGINDGIVIAEERSWTLVRCPHHARIAEEKKLSPEKNEAAAVKMIRLRGGDVLEAQKKKARASVRLTAATTGPKESSALDLPEAWEESIGRPSSLEEALDDVVRKLDNMGQNEEGKESEAQLADKRASSELDSPSKRLHLAAALCRQFTGETVTEGAGNDAPGAMPMPNRDPARRSNPKAKRNSRVSNAASSVAQAGDQDISDRDVLKGLSIICAASADTGLDAWIEAKTGLRLRRFLADLKALESLCRDRNVTMDDQRATRRRRGEHGRLEKKTRTKSTRASKGHSTLLSA